MRTSLATRSGDGLPVAGLLALAEGQAGAWAPEELGAVFRHQWSAPIEVHPSALDPGCRAKMGPLDGAPGERLRTYRDLFEHGCPPLGLLVRVKEYGKLHHGHPNSQLPREVALALYYTSIFVALVRLGRRITTLGDGTLQRAAEWLSGEAWVDEPTRTLVRDAVRKLRAEAAWAPMEPRGP